MDYEISLTETASRPTAVVAAATSWQEFRALWGRLLGEVWDCLRAGGITSGRWEVYGPNNGDPARQWTGVYWLLTPDA